MKLHNSPTDPFPHQEECLEEAIDRLYFAFLMDQGTGKTWTAIQWLMHYFFGGVIEGGIVIPPNSVKDQWGEQILQHAPREVEHNIGFWNSQGNAATRKAEARWDANFETRDDMMHWLIVNPEAWAMPRFQEFVASVMQGRKMALLLDESTRFKNRTAKRYKALMKVAGLAPVRGIMSGTPIIKSPMDAFAQFNFLSPNILGYKNFFTFRNRFGIMGGYKNKQVVSFKNLDELERKIKSCSFRVTKQDCLQHLPKKIGGVTDPDGPKLRKVQMQPDQKREYRRMQTDLMALVAELCKTCDGAGVLWRQQGDDPMDGYTDVCPDCHGESRAVLANIALTQVLRLQQITSGFVTDGPDTLHWFCDMPPKIAELMDIVEDAPDHAMLHWSVFRPELERLEQEFARRGLRYGVIHGGTSMPDRKRARNEFQDGSIDHLLLNPSAAGIGMDLWRASIANYVSCNRRTEDRVQSEDRCHRIGSEIHNSVLYNDIVVPGTIDMVVIRELRGEVKLSATILGDVAREKIQ